MTTTVSSRSQDITLSTSESLDGSTAIYIVNGGLTSLGQNPRIDYPNIYLTGAHAGHCEYRRLEVDRKGYYLPFIGRAPFFSYVVIWLVKKSFLWRVRAKM